MEDATEHRVVTFGGMRPSRSYSRIARRHVEKWIAREQSSKLPSLDARYAVHIDKESRDVFTCHIEISLGEREWSGIEEGRSIQEAVLKALQSLRARHELRLRPFLPRAVYENTA